MEKEWTKAAQGEAGIMTDPRALLPIADSPSRNMEPTRLDRRRAVETCSDSGAHWKGTMCRFPLNVSRETIGRAPHPHVLPGQIFDHVVQPARRFESEDVREDAVTIPASQMRVLCPMRA